MQDQLPLPRPFLSTILPLTVAAIIAAAIFVVDWVTTPEITIAPLFATVVLLVGRILDKRGILLVATGCVVLTIVALHNHYELSFVAFANLFASLATIGTTAYLVVRNRSADLVLREQARFLDVTHDAILVRDMNDVIIYWNRGAEELYGWRRGQAVGNVAHHLLQTVPPLPLDALKSKVLCAGRWEGEIFQTRRDGVQLTVASRWSLQRDHRGNPVSILVTNNDITGRKQAEDALQRSTSQLAHVTRVKTLDELVASIAHEVNQPLAAIVVNGEASLRWLDRPSPRLDEARNATERIISEGIRASEVIKRLRNLSEKGDAQRVPLDINQVINEVIPLIQHEALDHNVSLQMEAGSALPELLGDRVQLQQVMLNVLMNAIEAMSAETDHPRRVLIRTYFDDDDQVVVAVEDTGHGIGPENAARLFNPFFSTKGRGLGMGLSICRSIIQGHNGRIWASQNSERGTTLQFALPICREDAS